MKINAKDMHYKDLNHAIRESADPKIEVDNCLGQRYIASGLAGKDITINGIPGNALGAYLDGSNITVRGNAQDATGDTMNEGRIVIHGSAGDATGYAMRGGKIFVKDDVGYRAGIHMKAYEQKIPLIMIGGVAGSFLGEYQAGGTIIVLGKNCSGEPPVGYYCGTGMHGGKIYLCCDEIPPMLPKQVSAQIIDTAKGTEIEEHIREFCTYFGYNADQLLQRKYCVLTPNTKNPYKQLYTQN